MNQILSTEEGKYWFIASEENGKYWLYESDIKTIQFIIREMLCFEYYIIDKKYSWMLCENHHDILIGLGDDIADKLWKYETKIKPIGVVIKRFELSQRGLILCLKFTFEKYFLSIGDKVKLIKPNGEKLFTTITGISIKKSDILIEQKYSKKDIPIGTEMWLVE